MSFEDKHKKIVHMQCRAIVISQRKSITLVEHFKNLNNLLVIFEWLSLKIILF